MDFAFSFGERAHDSLGKRPANFTKKGSPKGRFAFDQGMVKPKLGHCDPTVRVQVPEPYPENPENNPIILRQLSICSGSFRVQVARMYFNPGKKAH